MSTDSLMDADRIAAELTVQRISDRNLIARLERKIERARKEIATALSEASERAEGYDAGLTQMQASTLESSRLRQGLLDARAILRVEQL